MIVLTREVDAEAKVLIVENNRQHVGWFKDVCQKIGFLMQNIRVRDRVITAEQEALEFGADVVILDLGGSETPGNYILGLETLDKWRSDNAVIVVTHFIDALAVIGGNSPAYTVLIKPARNETDRTRFTQQLSLAI